MLTIAWYLLKVMLCSGILFAYYLVALRNKKFHLYNRFYLLASVALSWIIPLAKINFLQETPEQSKVINLLTVVANGDRYVEQAHSFKWNWSIAVTAVSILVSAAFLTQLIVAIVKIRRLINSSPTKKWNDISFVFTNASGTPFSFFKYIFWNDQIDLNSCEGEQILKHELTHVQENHTADKMFLSIILIVSWYNPFFWIIRKELNMIHEFIADKKAISNGDTSAFAKMLLKTAFPEQSSILTNSFFHSPIKRRLIMLTSNFNPRYSYLRRLMILPLSTVVMLFFAFRLKEKKANANHKQQEVASFFDTVKEKPHFPGGAAGWDRYLKRKLDAAVGAKAGAPKGSYLVKVRFKVDKEGFISNITALTSHGFGFEDEAIKLIKKGPRWTPAKKDNIHVDCDVEQDFNFFVPPISASSKFPNHPELVLLNDKKLSWQDWQKMDMKGERIRNLNVLKGAAATTNYGEKEEDGVIEATTTSADMMKSDQQKFNQERQKYKEEQQKQTEFIGKYHEELQKYEEEKQKQAKLIRNYQEEQQQFAGYQQKFKEEALNGEKGTTAQYRWHRRN